jgi:hypothetical protein
MQHAPFLIIWRAAGSLKRLKNLRGALRLSHTFGSMATAKQPPKGVLYTKNAIVGDYVHAKASLIVSESECRRLYGSMWKTKWMGGTILDILTKPFNGRDTLFYDVNFRGPAFTTYPKEMKAIHCRPGEWSDPNPSPTIQLLGVEPIQPPAEADNASESSMDSVELARVSHELTRNKLQERISEHRQRRREKLASQNLLGDTDFDESSLSGSESDSIECCANRLVRAHTRSNYHTPESGLPESHIPVSVEVATHETAVADTNTPISVETAAAVQPSVVTDNVCWFSDISKCKQDTNGSVRTIKWSFKDQNGSWMTAGDDLTQE